MVNEQPEPFAEAAAEIRQGATRLAQRLRAERPAEALSINKLSVLSHLHRRGPTTAGELAVAEHQHPQSLTRVFAELERDGLVSRARGEHDRRQSLIAVTPAGRVALSRDMAERDVWLASAIAELTETETELLRLAARLMNRIADATPAAPRSEDHPTGGVDG